jgi:hypothetical protein
MSVATKRGGVLSAEERESFDRDGFLIVDDPCPPEVVDAVLAEFLPTFQEHLEDRYRTVFRDGGYCAIYALD